jgi:DNA polymerase II large subunit
MSLKLSSLIEHDELIIGASLSGDIILWETPSIFEAVDKRLSDQQQLDKLMSNPEEEQQAFSKIEEVAEVQVESLQAYRFIKNPLKISGRRKRVSINKIKAFKNLLAVAYTDGVAIFDMESLKEGKVKVLFDQIAKQNASQQISTEDVETNDVLFLTLKTQNYLVSANADCFVRLLDLNTFTTVCEINLTSPCICLTKIDEDLIAVGT